MMKQYFVITMATFFMMPLMMGQKYYSKVGRVSFSSDAPLEKIEATNTNGLIVLDAASGQIECSVLIKGFQFDKALMQEHFNENYMESHLYPKGLFKGTIANIKEINLTKDGTYSAKVNGNLTLHGVTKTISIPGQVIVKSGKIAASAAFDILVADYKIVVPKVVRENVAEKVKINISADLLPMN